MRRGAQGLRHAAKQKEHRVNFSLCSFLSVSTNRPSIALPSRGRRGALMGQGRTWNSSKDWGCFFHLPESGSGGRGDFGLRLANCGLARGEATALTIRRAPWHLRYTSAVVCESGDRQVLAAMDTRVDGGFDYGDRPIQASRISPSGDSRGNNPGEA